MTLAPSLRALVWFAATIVLAAIEPTSLCNQAQRRTPCLRKSLTALTIFSLNSKQRGHSNPATPRFLAPVFSASLALPLRPLRFKIWPFSLTHTSPQLKTSSRSYNQIRMKRMLPVLTCLLVASLCPAQEQSNSEPPPAQSSAAPVSSPVPVMDGGAGPCSLDLTIHAVDAN